MAEPWRQTISIFLLWRIERQHQLLTPLLLGATVLSLARFQCSFPLKLPPTPPPDLGVLGLLGTGKDAGTQGNGQEQERGKGIFCSLKTDSGRILHHHLSITFVNCKNGAYPLEAETILPMKKLSGDIKATIPIQEKVLNADTKAHQLFSKCFVYTCDC